MYFFVSSKIIRRAHYFNDYFSEAFNNIQSSDMKFYSEWFTRIKGIGAQKAAHGLIVELITIPCPVINGARN